MTKTQLDRLGDRIRKGNLTEEDLRLLDEYRRTFADAYENVASTIRSDLGLEPTGRPAKSTTSISDKLRRESIRLSQIQDIAGCRLVVTDVAEQDVVVQSLADLFENTTIIDRRKQPSHGYRAVHAIININGKAIEAQVRTSLQHLWAELSEKLSDVGDPAIKYGGGGENVKELLSNVSTLIVKQEKQEIDFAGLTAQVSALKKSRRQTEKIREITDKLNESLANMKKGIDKMRETIFYGLRKAIDEFGTEVGERNDISN